MQLTRWQGTLPLYIHLQEKATHTKSHPALRERSRFNREMIVIIIMMMMMMIMMMFSPDIVLSGRLGSKLPSKYC